MKRLIILFLLLISFTRSSVGQNECRNIGINLYFNKYWSTEMPFADLMMQAGTWLDKDFRPANPALFDFDVVTGYPTEVTPAKTLKRVVCLDNLGAHPSGVYTLTYEGKGEVILEGEDIDELVAVTNNFKTYRISPKGKGEIVLVLSESIAGDPIRNISLMLPGTQKGKDVFNPAFLEKLRPFTTIRFLNWTETNENTIERWDDRYIPEYYDQTTQRCVAYEYIVHLCNLLEKDLWLNIPHAANAKYIESLAKMLHTDLHKNRKIYLEYSNEVWNTYHKSHQWVAQQGANLHPDHQYKYAYYAGQAFKQFGDHFTGGNVTRVLCGQQAWSEVALRSARGMQHFQLTDTYDAISCTGNLYFTDADQNLAKSKGASLTADEVLDMLENTMFRDVIPNMDRHKTIADTNSKRLVTYESTPYALVQYPQWGIPPPHANAIYESIYHPRMKDIYTNWIDILFDQMDLDMMMAFVLADDNRSHYGSYGHLDHVFQEVPFPPAYQSLLDVSCLTSVNDNDTKYDLKSLEIFPNPTTSSILNIRAEGIISSINILDNLGRKVQKYETNSSSEEVQLGPLGLPPGLYFIHAGLTNGKQSMGKVIVH